MDWYTPQPPSAELADVATCSWTAMPTGVHRLVPDACVDVLWTSTGHALLCGPETTAWTFAVPEGTTAVGVRLLPGVAPCLFRLPASKMLDRRIRLDGLLDSTSVERLRDDMAAHRTVRSRCSTFENFVAELVGRRRAAGTTIPDSFSAEVLTTLVASPRVSVDVLAASLSVSPRQLHRRCLLSFGYGAAVLARLLRFHRMLGLRSGSGEELRLAVLATAAGYADQAHLTRDCRAITGLTPTAFLREWFPTFPDMSDPFKTTPVGWGILA